MLTSNVTDYPNSFRSFENEISANCRAAVVTDGEVLVKSAVAKRKRNPELRGRVESRKEKRPEISSGQKFHDRIISVWIVKKKKEEKSFTFVFSYVRFTRVISRSRPDSNSFVIRRPTPQSAPDVSVIIIADGVSPRVLSMNSRMRRVLDRN